MTSLAVALAAVVLQQDLKSVADRVHSAVIEVRAIAPVSVGDETVPTATFGAGVVVGHGLAVTTLHNVAAVSPGKLTPFHDIEVLLPGGAQTATIVASYPELDLAVLKVPTGDEPAPELATAVPARGAPLIAMGADDQSVNAVGVQLAGSSGDVLLLTSSRPVDSRYWGGPIFDAQGRLAGISLPSVLPRALSAPALAALLARVQAP